MEMLTARNLWLMVTVTNILGTLSKLVKGDNTNDMSKIRTLYYYFFSDI